VTTIAFTMIAMTYSIFDSTGNLVDAFTDRAAALDCLAGIAQAEPESADDARRRLPTPPPCSRVPHGLQQPQEVAAEDLLGVLLAEAAMEESRRHVAELG
jgi:hypothetical protein